MSNDCRKCGSSKEMCVCVEESCGHCGSGVDEVGDVGQCLVCGASICKDCESNGCKP